MDFNIIKPSEPINFVNNNELPKKEKRKYVKRKVSNTKNTVENKSVLSILKDAEEYKTNNINSVDHDFEIKNIIQLKLSEADIDEVEMNKKENINTNHITTINDIYNDNIHEIKAFESDSIFNSNFTEMKIDEDSELNFNVNNNNDNNCNICLKCYWCFYEFTNKNYGLPISYSNNIFTTFGKFCSLECSSAYNFYNNELGNDRWKSNSLINLMNYLINSSNDIVKPAPLRHNLIIFGGNMSIDEFRNNQVSSIINTHNLNELYEMVYVKNNS